MRRFIPTVTLVLMLPLLSWAYESVTVTDGATLKGKVSFQGTAPAPKKLLINKNPEVCGTGYRERQEVKVSAQGGLQEAVVFVMGIKQGKTWPTPAGGYMLDQKQCDFQPYLQVVPRGTNVDIVNSDPVLHNIHTYELIGRARRTLFNFAQPNAGMKIAKPIRTRRGQIVRVECDAHNFMLGWIVALKNPYYAIVDAEGGFTITDVPAGTYDVQAWHPFLGIQKSKVTLPSKGEAEVEFTYQAK